MEWLPSLAFKWEYNIISVSRDMKQSRENNITTISCGHSKGAITTQKIHNSTKQYMKSIITIARVNYNIIKYFLHLFHFVFPVKYGLQSFTITRKFNSKNHLLFTMYLHLGSFVLKASTNDLSFSASKVS